MERASRPGADVEPDAPLRCSLATSRKEGFMLKGGVLWLLGIPLPIIIVLWFMGYL